MNKDIVSKSATVILTLCALAVTGLFVRQEFMPPADTGRLGPHPIKNWQSLATVGHIIGSPEAPVQIIEFSDFQCPFCNRLQPILDRLRTQYPDDVQVIYRHYPLTSIHPYSFAAALASECAAAQGRFESYQNALFANQDSLGIISFHVLAHRARVPDISQFRRCVRDKRFHDRVERDYKAARSIGLRGTPSIIVDGVLLPGTPSYSELEYWMLKALKRDS